MLPAPPGRAFQYLRECTDSQTIQMRDNNILSSIYLTPKKSADFGRFCRWPASRCTGRLKRLRLVHSRCKNVDFSRKQKPPFLRRCPKATPPSVPRQPTTPDTGYQTDLVINDNKECRCIASTKPLSNAIGCLK